MLIDMIAGVIDCMLNISSVPNFLISVLGMLYWLVTILGAPFGL